MVEEKKGEYDANIKKASDGRGASQRHLEEVINKAPVKGEGGKKRVP